MSCSHKFIDSTTCLKCGVHVDTLRAESERERAELLKNGGPADAARMLACMNTIFDALRTGATFSLQGSGPLSSTDDPRFAARLSSHSGARYSDGNGATLGACLEQLVAEWKVL
jgi:hypothetical protein